MKKLLWIASLITLQVWALEDESQSELLANEFRLNGTTTQMAFEDARDEALGLPFGWKETESSSHWDF